MSMHNYANTGPYASSVMPSYSSYPSQYSGATTSSTQSSTSASSYYSSGPSTQLAGASANLYPISSGTTGSSSLYGGQGQSSYSHPAQLSQHGYSTYGSAASAPGSQYASEYGSLLASSVAAQPYADQTAAYHHHQSQSQQQQQHQSQHQHHHQQQQHQQQHTVQSHHGIGATVSFTASGGLPMRPKRKQVKNACINCQKACKKCDEGRPCSRCVKYGLIDTCQDSSRKERKKGIKRGPYKRKATGDHSRSSASSSSLQDSKPPRQQQSNQQQSQQGGQQYQQAQYSNGLQYASDYTSSSRSSAVDSYSRYSRSPYADAASHQQSDLLDASLSGTTGVPYSTEASASSSAYPTGHRYNAAVFEPRSAGGGYYGASLPSLNGLSSSSPSQQPATLGQAQQQQQQQRFHSESLTSASTHSTTSPRTPTGLSGDAAPSSANFLGPSALSTYGGGKGAALASSTSAASSSSAPAYILQPSTASGMGGLYGSSTTSSSSSSSPLHQSAPTLPQGRMRFPTTAHGGGAFYASHPRDDAEDRKPVLSTSDELAAASVGTRSSNYHHHHQHAQQHQQQQQQQHHHHHHHHHHHPHQAPSSYAAPVAAGPQYHHASPHLPLRHASGHGGFASTSFAGMGLGGGASTSTTTTTTNASPGSSSSAAAAASRMRLESGGASVLLPRLGGGGGGAEDLVGMA